MASVPCFCRCGTHSRGAPVPQLWRWALRPLGELGDRTGNATDGPRDAQSLLPGGRPLRGSPWRRRAVSRRRIVHCTVDRSVSDDTWVSLASVLINHLRNRFMGSGAQPREVTRGMEREF